MTAGHCNWWHQVVGDTNNQPEIVTINQDKGKKEKQETCKPQGEKTKQQK